MRQAQHNKRSRGRSRKSGSSGNRVYESNGPDVKVRGNASHIAEKYVNLARDASSGGDLVAAENYLQHAEHYFRLVAVAQSQIRQDQVQVQNRAQQGGDQPTTRPSGEGPDGDASGTVPEDGGQIASSAGADSAAEPPEEARSTGRNRRPSEERGATESGDGGASDEAKNPKANGADAGDEQPVDQVEEKPVPKAGSQRGEESEPAEEVAEADANL